MFDTKKIQKLEKLSGELEKLLCEFEALVSNDESEEDEIYGDLVWNLSQVWAEIDEFVYIRLTKEE